MIFTMSSKGYFTLSIAILWTSSYHAMEHSSAIIRKEDDIRPFMHQIVAYTTKLNYFGRDQGYPINRDSSIKYGYITKKMAHSDLIQSNTPHKIRPNIFKTDDGYLLNKFLKKEDIPQACYLVDCELTNDILCMRQATPHEARRIIKAIDENKATFDYRGKSWDEALLRALKDLTKQNKSKK